ncbi:MAG: rhodanese-like domain-containing protein [Desulfovibrionaceae bacterium]|jgi:rhodanese-related sulfurtransferase/glyoxylase-like metal-dependent hydrolase (beta-lactamase superfamily II)
MFFQQITVEGLGCFSYAVGCPAIGEMAVVDPKRDVQTYLDISRREGMRITRVFDTHVHADHVSGAQELASQTGAAICMSRHAPVSFPFTKLTEGDVIEFGAVRLEVLETPGHTPNSISLLLTDLTRGQEPWMVLTGDVLFVGDIGRPDLVGEAVLEEQVKNLWDSLYVKLAKHPDHLEVFPAHGMGSLCGRGMSAKTSSTLGFERRHNPMLGYPDFESFHEAMTHDFPARPKSFTHIIETNMGGAPLLERCPLDRSLSPERFAERMEQGAVVIDARSAAAFGGFHIPGALSIGLEKQVANWVGMVVDPSADLLLVVEDEADYEAMTTQLHRIGYDNIYGWLAGGISSWLYAGRPLEKLNQISVQELESLLKKPAPPVVLDVRTPAEWKAGRIPGAQHYPVTKILEKAPELNRAAPICVVCGTGYRSNIAASELIRQGFEDVFSMAGGTTAWTRAGYGLEK